MTVKARVSGVSTLCWRNRGGREGVERGREGVERGSRGGGTPDVPRCQAHIPLAMRAPLSPASSYY
eukprot:330190-Prorocentrum_minimum.AAC.1